MRGSIALFTSDDLQKKITHNICNIEAAYACILSHPDDQLCILNKIVYRQCMNTMNPPIKYDKAIKSQNNNRYTSLKPSD